MVGCPKALQLMIPLPEYQATGSMGESEAAGCRVIEGPRVAPNMMSGTEAPDAPDLRLSLSLHGIRMGIYSALMQNTKSAQLFLFRNEWVSGKMEIVGTLHPSCDG